MVPAYTSSSIFCEKHRSGDAGEREKVSGERGCCSGVIGGCDMLSWLPWLFSRKSSLGVESSSSSDMSVCGELCGQGSAEIVSVSRGCCGGVVLSCPFCCRSPVVLHTVSRCVCAIQIEWIDTHCRRMIEGEVDIVL